MSFGSKVIHALDKLVKNTSRKSLIVNASDIRRREPLVNIEKLNLKGKGRIRPGTSEPVYYWPDVEEAIEEYFFSLPVHEKLDISILQETNEDIRYLIPEI